jgi:hypothetical protein
MSSNTNNISSINSLRQNNDQYDSPLDIPIWVGDKLVGKPRNTAFKAGLEDAKKADQEAAIRQEFIEAAEYNRGY